MKMIFAISAAASLVMALAAPVGAQTVPGRLVLTVAANRATPAERLVGETVYNDKGQDIGSIVEVTPGGQAAAPTAILSVADGTGVRAKLLAVPLSPGAFDAMSGPDEHVESSGSGNSMNWLQGGGG